MVYDTSVDRQEIARAKAHVWDLQCEGSGTLSPCAICYDYDSQPVLKMFLWLGFLVWFGFWGFFCLFVFFLVRGHAVHPSELEGRCKRPQKQIVI